MDRNPIVAGQFYPATPMALKDEIKRLIQPNAPKQQVIGVVSPHAGYIYSGPVAGAAFSRIHIPDTCVILGPNHTGRGSAFSIMTRGKWHTPLGDVAIDSALATQILENSTHLREDSAAHLFEHSIEVQVPFLQYSNANVRIVPIIMAPAEADIYKEIGRAIADAVKVSERDVVIVASSDMTHYEPQESAQKKDAEAIKAILDLDEDELLRKIDTLHITMCGYAPVVALISAAKELGGRSAELVEYRTSGDATGDRRKVVGYAGILIKR